MAGFDLDRVSTHTHDNMYYIIIIYSYYINIIIYVSLVVYFSLIFNFPSFLGVVGKLFVR